MTANPVRDNPSRHRFELEIDGHSAVAHYALDSGVITFMHTEVPAELGGRGIGSQLARGALEQARARGLRVVAQCPFIAAYIAKHPEYGDLTR
jgi:predicted GNAT family acetyltransferase